MKQSFKTNDHIEIASTEKVSQRRSLLVFYFSFLFFFPLSVIAQKSHFVILKKDSSIITVSKLEEVVLPTFDYVLIFKINKIKNSIKASDISHYKYVDKKGRETIYLSLPKFKDEKLRHQFYTQLIDNKSYKLVFSSYIVYNNFVPNFGGGVGMGSNFGTGFGIGYGFNSGFNNGFNNSSTTIYKFYVIDSNGNFVAEIEGDKQQKNTLMKTYFGTCQAFTEKLEKTNLNNFDKFEKLCLSYKQLCN